MDSKITKIAKSLITVSGLLLCSLSAHAVTSTGLTFRNNTPHTIQLSNVSWSGSYFPQFPTTIPAGAAPTATLKRVLSTAQLSFNAKNTTTNQTCYFTVTFCSSSYAIQGIRTSSDPLAECYASGTSFFMGLGDYAPFTINDIDEDSVPDNKDNCLYIPNPSQEDTDNNGVGYYCDENEQKLRTH